ncbi:hypothetical protein HMPREF0201_00824 [Cedecea davisae DSM 4568]|uniref:Uncharacterized protein n=1 Tax=Cedecea davisae DSM 4568 TaxID=566551 RepID=S3J326_9ENTR|nr:hypothetical protein HMPREF0201_00824 [Cedecea davisae DSM 4568]
MIVFSSLPFSDLSVVQANWKALFLSAGAAVPLYSRDFAVNYCSSL